LRSHMIRGPGRRSRPDGRSAGVAPGRRRQRDVRFRDPGGRAVWPVPRPGVPAWISPPSTLLVAAVACLVLAIELLPPLHVVNPRARAAVETVIALSAIATGCLLIANFRRERQWIELLLLCALIGASLADIMHNAAPSLTGLRGLSHDNHAWLGCELIAGVALVAAALTPPHSSMASARELTRFGIVFGIGSAVLAALLVQVTMVGRSASVVAPLDHHAVVVGVHCTSAAMLVLAAIAFMADGSAGGGSAVLAAACVLLGGANLQYLAIPQPAADWVTAREGLRFGAYGLLLGFACVRYASLRRRENQAAICSERERIVRDLHDGLAQDLACIAVQGQRLDANLGPEHPLMIAVRQAVVATRGVIADLTASTAPTTEAALRVVADELGHRFDLQVAVRIETDAAPGLESELAPSQREHLIQIAREAIVNAALHGPARRVDVVLFRRGRTLVMRVSDDGRGIPEGQPSGFGLRTMRARAAALGGQVNATPAAGGGTELELVVSGT
jgi:signal transduction histidine kinase